MRASQRIAGAAQTSSGARRAQVALGLIAGLGPVGVVALAVALGASAAARSPASIVAAGVAAVLVGAAWTTALSSLSELFGQRARDLRAAALFAALERGEPVPPFSVYLRPFVTTDALEDQMFAPLAVGRWSLVLGSVPVRFELEQQVERAVRRFAPLVAVGRPLEHVGAGRIAVEGDAWRDAVALLVARAALIVLLPSTRAGTRWEVEHILGSDAVTRTVVVDPPPATGRYAQHEEWAGVREAFQARGYALPPDDPAGRLLYYADARSPVAACPLDLDREGRIRRFFRTVLSRPPSSRGAG